MQMKMVDVETIESLIARQERKKSIEQLIMLDEMKD
jgi:hypothetical protein